MRLTLRQWIWLGGAVAFWVALLLDLVDLLAVPNLLWLAAAGLLLLGARAMPSLEQLKGLSRRG